MYAILRFFKNSTFILLNHPLDTVVLKVNLEFLFTAPSINKRVIKRLRYQSLMSMQNL
jgi:hypothetical protein